MYEGIFVNHFNHLASFFVYKADLDRIDVKTMKHVDGFFPFIFFVFPN